MRGTEANLKLSNHTALAAPSRSASRRCQVEAVVDACRDASRHTRQVIIIGIDLAKNSFQLHGARADGSVAFRKKVSRVKLLDFVAEQPRCTVATCGGSASSGPGDRRSRPYGTADPAGLCQALRQAAAERRCGRRGDLRGGLAADHAVCGCEDGGTVAADRVGPSSITVLKRKRSRPSPRMSDRIFWIILSCL